MNILVISDSFPKNNFDGIFVYKRLLQYAKNNISYSVIKPKICLRRNMSWDKESNYIISGSGDIENVHVDVVNVIRLPGSYYLLGFTKQLETLIIENRIDVIHCHFLWNAFNVLNTVKKFNLPLIVTAHGSDIHTFPLKNRLFRYQSKIVLNKADAVIFVSDFLKQKAIDLFGLTDNMHVIPNGIDGSFIKNNMNHQNKESRSILFIGRLEEIKRVRFLPLILSALKEKGYECELHIVGKGSQKELITTIAREKSVEGHIFFQDHIPHDDVPNVLEGKDCVLLISKNEGWPCVVLEAQASGVPVIGTTNGGIPEAIGDGGFTVSDDDLVSNVVNAVIKVFENPFDSEKLIERARQYTWESIVEKEIKLIKSVIESR